MGDACISILASTLSGGGRGRGAGEGALTIMAKRSWYLVTIAYTVRLRAKGFKYVYNREQI